jgi:hypothetical protein
MAHRKITPEVAAQVRQSAADTAAKMNVAAQLTVTAFTDGRPIDVRANCDPLNALLLLAAGITNAVKVVQQQQIPVKGQADQVDKERKFLGPRSE